MIDSKHYSMLYTICSLTHTFLHTNWYVTNPWQDYHKVYNDFDPGRRRDLIEGIALLVPGPYYIKEGKTSNYTSEHQLWWPVDMQIKTSTQVGETFESESDEYICDLQIGLKNFSLTFDRISENTGTVRETRIFYDIFLTNKNNKCLFTFNPECFNDMIKENRVSLKERIRARQIKITGKA